MKPLFGWAPRDGPTPGAVMLTDEDGLVHRPFGAFRVESERLPDGRTIRYYSWPSDSEEDEERPPDAASTAVDVSDAP